MTDAHPTVTHGYCQCGCGKQAPVAQRTDNAKGYVKGEPMRYCRGHANRGAVHFIEEDRGFTTPCWIWQLSRTTDGYGHMSDGTGRQRPAHRVMWERQHGAIPAGLQLDHLCRVRACVNPDHLEPVTNATNTRRSNTAKLTSADVAEIRQAVEQGTTYTMLATRYGVCIATIGHIATGRNWRGG